MKKRENRVNEKIRVTPIRLIGPDGEQIGIIPTREALERAREAGLDLVEVSPMARPPVCRILDYGKFKYNQSKKAMTSKKKQHVVNIKGMRFRPKTEEHDYQFKLKHIKTFLGQGNKVKAFVLFRGREKAHPEFGHKILDRLTDDLSEEAVVESRSNLEGNSMYIIIAPMTAASGSQSKEKSGRKQKEAAQEIPAAETVAEEASDD